MHAQHWQHAPHVQQAQPSWNKIFNAAQCHCDCKAHDPTHPNRCTLAECFITSPGEQSCLYQIVRRLTRQKGLASMSLLLESGAASSHGG